MTPAALAVLFILATEAPPRAAEDPRDDFEHFERVLDAAVHRVSPASVAHVLGVGDTCQAYELKGYGAVFVLAPRLLPSPRQGRILLLGPGAIDPGAAAALDALRTMQADLGSSPTEQEIRKQLEALAQEIQREEQRTRGGADRRGGVRAADAREVRAIEAQAEAFQREARRAREEAERTLEELRRELRVRIVGSPAPSVATPVSGGTQSPPRPQPVEAPPEPPSPPAPPGWLAPPTPPWQSWFEVVESPPDPRTAEVVVRDVRAAITAALSASGSAVRALRPEEVIVVAVDFFPPDAFGTRSRPARTLVVRARKKDLLEHEAGRTSADELVRRIEYSEY